MKKNEELAVAQNNELALPVQDALGMDAMMEELEGLGPISLEQVKIPPGGMTMFALPGDDPENPEYVQALSGVIVHHQPKNVYFKDPFGSGETKAPDCSSADGKTGIMTVSRTEKNCANCRFNQFGSAASGNGKACQNRIDLYIMQEGSNFPIILSLPATSIKAFKNYLTGIVLKGNRLYQVATEIKLKKVKNEGGIDYATCTFKKTANVAPEELPDLAEMRELCKSLALTVKTAATVDESTGEIVDLPDVEDAELPFD